MKNVIIAFLILLTSCSNETTMDLVNTVEITEKLSSLKGRVKFIEGDSVFYSGAPNEDIRLKAQSTIDNLILALLSTPNEKLNTERVFNLFVVVAAPLQEMDSEELERGLEYMEEIMGIYDIESSNGLLNELRYGFNPIK